MYNKVSPGGGETICQSRRWQFAANLAISIYMYIKIAADLRPSADGSADLWWPAMAKLPAASVPIA